MDRDLEVAQAVGTGDLRLFSKINYGGGAAVGTILQAAMAVAAGTANHVVCYRAMNGRSGQPRSVLISSGVGVPTGAMILGHDD